MLDLIKKLRKSTKNQIIINTDTKIIKSLKKRFQHSIRTTFYDDVAYNLDSLYCHAVPGTIEKIISIIGEQKLRKEKLINLGGGTGQVANIYRELGYIVYNLDIDIKKNTKFDFKYDLNSSKDMPIKVGTFDKVICQEIIEHIENPWELIRKSYDLLNDKGTIIVSTPNILSKKSKKIFQEKGYFHWFTPECFSYHINPIPVWEIINILNNVGFKKIKIHGSGDYYFGKNKTYTELLDKNEGLIIQAYKI